jgi:Carboxypeptidase regulatory-like domain
MKHSIRARHWVLAWCFLGGLIPPAGRPQGIPVATVQGTVVTDTSAAIANATVALFPVGDTSRFSGSTVTSAAGAFTFRSVPAGTYVVCARPASTAYTDSCLWGIPRVIAEVPGAPGAPSIVIPLKKTSVLKVRLNDSAAFLRPLPTEKFPPHVAVGVWGGRGFLHAHEVKKDSTGIDYELPVPADTPLPLRVYSRSVKLQLGGNSPIAPQGYSSMLFFDSKKPAPSPLVFATVGRLP